MNQTKIIAVIVIVCAVASLTNAATIPAGTTLAVTTVSLITSQDAVGSSFEAKIAQDVSVKGSAMLKAGTKAFGKVHSSRRNPRKSEALSGADTRRGEWPQSSGEDEHRRTAWSTANWAPGAV